MLLKPASRKAIDLIQRGIDAFSYIESVGIKIDLRYLRREMEQLNKERIRLMEQIRDTEEYGILRRRYGVETNPCSDRQLAALLFDEMKLPVVHRTPSGAPAVDSTVLSDIGTDFCSLVLRAKQNTKLVTTFLKGIMTETGQDGRLHPSFNLHIPATYRSSSDSINFQNLPIRDPRMAKSIRRAFVARKGYHLVETDYVGVEVKGAACYHKDPRMLSYIKDPDTDMHRDMAAQCFRLPELGSDFWGSKDSSTGNGSIARYCAKNMFVFPQFYGDFYASCARSLWDAINKHSLTVPVQSKKKTKVISMEEHLRRVGIEGRGMCDPPRGVRGYTPTPGTFERHIYDVEDDFWNNRFKDYGQWRKDWYAKYQRTGGFTMLSGFRCEGVFNRKAVINWPVQGSSFHILLWSLVECNRIMRERNMKSKIVGQIHDSIVGEVHRSELSQYVDILYEVMVNKVRKHYRWIIVPLDIEMEISPAGGSWYEKKAVDYRNYLTT